VSVAAGTFGNVLRVGRAVLIWLGLALLWLLYQGDVNGVELVAAGCGALVGTGFLLLLRAHALPAARVEARFAARAARVPWLVLKEFVYVTQVLARTLRHRPKHVGEFRAVRFPTGGARPAECGRRAFVASAITATPNSYVVGFDEDEHRILVHVLKRVPIGEELL
jgi:multisubunit Na+/H+ antiporter MnhE subunit